MNQPYIFESSKNSEFDGNEAVVVLPDIYCQTDYSKQTVEQFATAFSKPTFMFDYFFLCTKEANNFSVDDREKAQNCMKDFNGDSFVEFFPKVLGEIQQAYTGIQKFVVVGFCFGGRLAYIAGGEQNVSKIFSFYGGGAHTPGYVANKTPVEYLISKRTDTNLQITSFFGINDPSIPESDRQKLKEEFAKSQITYQAYEYDAGHAYFQEGRPNYNASASQASWEVLRNI